MAAAAIIPPQAGTPATPIGAPTSRLTPVELSSYRAQARPKTGRMRLGRRHCAQPSPAAIRAKTIAKPVVAPRNSA